MGVLARLHRQAGGRRTGRTGRSTCTTSTTSSSRRSSLGVVWLFVRYRRRRADASAPDARPPELLQIVALGLIQGAAELLPVSSSAHVAAVPWLLGWDIADWYAARRKELEVALHAGAALALAPAFVRLGAGPGDARAVARAAGDRRVALRAGDRGGSTRSLGLSPDAAALAAADLATGSAPAGAPGWWLGPGAGGGAGARRLAHRRDAGRCARARVLAGGGVAALVRRRRAGARGRDALKAWRARRRRPRLVAPGRWPRSSGARAALASGSSGEAWWPYSIERAVLAGALLRAERGGRVKRARSRVVCSMRVGALDPPGRALLMAQ